MDSLVEEVTTLLQRIEQGDAEAQNRLLATAYEQLRDIAKAMMRHERPDHTLQPTALVNEASIRLLGENALKNVKDRRYFFGAVSNAMRQVLVDHARKRGSQKRGGAAKREPLEQVTQSIELTHRLDVLELSESIDQLRALSGRQAEVVTMRFFGGFELKEIAETLDVSLSTVEKDWRIARAWLRSRLSPTTGGAST